MNILIKPITTKQVVCHNGKDVYHFVEVEPNLVCRSGQPTMDIYDTKAELETEIKKLDTTQKNLDDLIIFMEG